MASEMPPTDAEQPKSLLAQYQTRLMWRLAAWGGAAAFSLAAVVIVSQTASGHKRLRVALFGSEQPYQMPTSVASTTVPMPPPDLIAVKRSTEAVRRATERTAARLETVEQNTAETRAETKRLALQVSKLRADSFRVTGRLANIETQIGGITGSIRKQAEEAAAAAVTRAMPKPAFDTRTFDVTAPIISPPATLYPKLSLIVPQAPASTSSPTMADGPGITKETKDRDKTKPDVTITSSIKKGNSKDQSRVASRVEGKAEPEAKRTAQPHTEELKAGIALEMKAAPQTKQHSHFSLKLKPGRRPNPGKTPSERARRGPRPRTLSPDPHQRPDESRDATGSPRAATASISAVPNPSRSQKRNGRR